MDTNGTIIDEVTSWQCRKVSKKFSTRRKGKTKSATMMHVEASSDEVKAYLQELNDKGRINNV